jgi:hypothetical protein
MSNQFTVQVEVTAEAEVIPANPSTTEDADTGEDKE